MNHVGPKGKRYEKTTCEKCKKEISVTQFSRHSKFCQGYVSQSIQESWRQANGLYRCPYCNTEKTKSGLGTHIWRKHTEKGQRFTQEHDCNVGFKNGVRVNWRKGLTKADPRIAKSVETFRDIARKETVPWNRNKLMNDSFRNSVKRGMKKAVDEGRQKTLKPGGITRCFDHISWEQKAFVLQGPYEKTFAEFLDSKKITWEKNQKQFPYVYEDETKKYKPDFYLKDYDVYVETKGYETDKDHAKWRDFPHKLFIVRLAELKALEAWYEQFLRSVAERSQASAL